MGSAAEWDEVAAALAGDYRCIVPDLPGHGVSTGLPYPESYTMDGASHALITLLNAEGVDRCTVAGYSMGGRLGLYLALRHPRHVGRLLLESASPGLATEEERAARRAADEGRARWLETGSVREFVEDWYRQPLFATLARDEPLLRRTIEARLENDPRELARSLREMGTGSQPSLWKELADLCPPTLAVAGEMDAKFVALARRMEASSPTIRAIIVEEAGHGVHAETLGAYIGPLKKFLEEGRST